MKRHHHFLNRLQAIVGMLFAPLFLSGCVEVTLAWADLKPAGDPATPPLFESAAAPSLEIWETDLKPTFRKALETHVYGTMPDASAARIVDRRVVDEAAYNGKGRYEEITFVASATFGDVARETAPVIIALVTPNNASGKVPTILMESFSQRWRAIPHKEATRPEGARSSSSGIGGLALYVFGRYIETPPLEEILDRGYAVALIYPGDFVPDSRTRGLEALAHLSEGYGDDETRWGAIAAWGWGFSKMIDVLEEHPRLDPDRFVTYGHSRYGKSALVAAAYDDRVAGVISHQSGTGGASLNKRKKGESVSRITDTYPHWFSEKYASYAKREEAMPIDQHHLLALIAPRPILFGNARRDVWSDPNGALKAALGADRAYKLYGQEVGLRQERYKPYHPDAELSLWIRPGTHGVTEEDWPAFLEFLDAHF